MIPSAQSLSKLQVRAAMGAYLYSNDMVGRYTYFNELVYQLFKAPLNLIPCEDDSCFFDLQVTRQMQLNERRVLEFDKTLSAEESIVLESCGETMTIWTFNSPIRNVRGEVVGLTGKFSDITKSKKIEQELQEQRGLIAMLFEHVGAHAYMKKKDRRYGYVN